MNIAKTRTPVKNVVQIMKEENWFRTGAHSQSSHCRFSINVGCFMFQADLTRYCFFFFCANSRKGSKPQPHSPRLIPVVNHSVDIFCTVLNIVKLISWVECAKYTKTYYIL